MVRANNCRQTGRPRWKYTFAHIVFITDEFSQREVTSYTLPIEKPLVPLSVVEQQHHESLRARLLFTPSACTSHSIVVEDQSGSIRTSDVDDFRTRSDAVFGTIALDLIGKHLDDDQGAISGTDVMTIVEMRDEATTVFYREPLTNVLFNKVVAHMVTWEILGRYRCGHGAMELDEPEDSCAVMLMFLSDGKPSDGKKSFIEQLKSRMDDLGARFGPRLRVGMIGFAGSGNDFSVLQDMTKMAQQAGAHGTFSNPQVCATKLSSAVTELRSDLSATRTALMTTGMSMAPRKLQEVSMEQQFLHLTSNFMEDGQWTVYLSDVQRYVLIDHPKHGQGLKNWKQVELFQPTATGIAIRKRIFALGAERIVYQLCEIEENRSRSHLNLQRYRIVGPLMVGKDSKFIEQDDENAKISFHEVFCKTQREAGKWADRFNAATASFRVPKIAFLDCSVYEFDGKGLLVEKLLDNAKYKKWNGNNGYVDGQSTPRVPSMEKLLRQLDAKDTMQLDAIQEMDEDDEEAQDDPVTPSASAEVPVEDIPQAFSHFTFWKSHRNLLVCDLQGVFNAANNVFELTDPVIHHAASKGKKREYGRTDRGQAGMHRFFTTHHCNALCTLLRLPACH
ncbi:unnamed protein product [Aphanomyces euteiches]|uniref:Alpha-type protein kinase domain-containing protein n=1 Tax=Aphanomyces euteiches TaxID=100861 RepID=A0A6G0X2V1_9STRA|nr:hypothetical protein Ae201684_009034 [Aphanomyces euteiches]KAH9073634.1 hypothetical protein Ae201684P_003138 [Aphanomyces euteiches]